MWEGLLEPLVMRPRTHGQLVSCAEVVVGSWRHRGVGPS